MTIGDCKLSSDANLLTIMKGKGYFVAPLAMYNILKEDLKKYVIEEKRSLELLKQTKKSENLTVSYFGFEVPAEIVDNEETIVSKKKIGRGRSCSTSEYMYTEKKTYKVNHSMNEGNIKIEEKICGYFVIATNKTKDKLSMKQALGCYKQEWQVERIFERLKGLLQVISIYLKDPRHIEAMMYLLVTCAHIFTFNRQRSKEYTCSK